MISETKHTPGPKVEKQMGEFAIFRDYDGPFHCVGTAGAEADANLFAAAPDLMEALKVTARGIESEFGPRVAEVNFPALYAAIAKAEGH